MKKYFCKIVFAITALCLICCGCARQPIAYKSMDTAMGTIISQSIYISASKDEEAYAEQISEAVLGCITEWEEETLSWRLETSEIFKLNESAGTGRNVQLSDKLCPILDTCVEIREASGGAFDFAIGALARIWDIDKWSSNGPEEFVFPSEQSIATALESLQQGGIDWTAPYIRVAEGVQLDLGAVGKGIVLDEIKELLEKYEEQTEGNPRVTGATISVGGSILTYGSKPDGGTWNVAIVDPFDTSKSLGILTLSGQWCVSTSGDYERYVELGGVRYHHILDPFTGMPADSGVKSVTILSKSGLQSDALSTACFVLGVEKGMSLAEAYGAEVLFVDDDGEIIMSEGMQEIFRR